MEKLNEMSVKLEKCVEHLNSVQNFDTKNKVDQAVVVLDMAKAYIEDALDRFEEREVLERKLTDCFCAITSVLETLDNALSAEHDVIYNVERTLREIV